jgi:hypothetical protein
VRIGLHDVELRQRAKRLGIADRIPLLTSEEALLALRKAQDAGYAAPGSK